MSKISFFILLSLVLFQASLFAQPCGDPPPVSYPCEAEPICGFQALDNYCLDMGDDPVGGPIIGCPNVLNNPNWFAFVAGGGPVTITITPTECTEVMGQAGIHGGIYSGTCDDLEVVDTDCGDGTVQTITYTATLEAGQTYWVLLDGWGGSQCHIEVDVEGNLNPPIPGNPTYIEFPEIPEFEGPDTVCLGAEDVLFTTSEAFGASSYLWWLPDGTSLSSDDPTINIDFVPISDWPAGEYTIYVQAINDCATSDSLPYTFFIAPIDEVFEEDEVCEGEPYMWTGPNQQPFNTNAEDLDPGTYQFQTTRMNQYACDYIANLELVIHPENDENPTQIDTAICYDGGGFSHPSGYSTVTGEDNEDYTWYGGSEAGCDSFLNFTVEVVGGLFSIRPPEGCNGDGSFNLESIFMPLSGFNSVPLTHPDITIDYEWLADGNVIDEDQFTVTGENNSILNIDQEMLEAYGPYFSVQYEVSIDYPGLQEGCVFTSNVFNIETSDYVPAIDSIVGPESLCFGSSGTYEVYFQDPENDYFVDDVTAWFWEAPDGVSIEGNGGNPITVEVGSGAEAGDICVEIQTDCGFTDYTCIPVDIDNPVDPQIGAVDNDPCTFSYTFSPEIANEGQWIVVDQPANSQVEFSDITDPNATMDVDSTGTYAIAWQEGVPGCEKFDTVALTFTGGPQISGIVETCNDPPTDYVVTFEISGGTPPYSVVIGNGTISGNTFTSDAIPQMTSYTFQIEDANGCLSELIEGNKICDCETEAAMMESDTLETCGDVGCVMGVPADNPTLDGDDVVQFALHEGSGNSLQNVIEIRDGAMFCYQDGINYGQIYYISRIVGSDDGNDAVDLNDGCLSVAPGQPVIWYEQPVADAGMAQIDSCGQTAVLMANPSVGNGSWSLVSGPGSATFSPDDAPMTTVDVDAFGTYTFEWREQNAFCEDADTVTVVFHDPPRLVPASLNAECLPSLDYILTFQVEGGTPPYVLLNGDGELNGNFYRDTLNNQEEYNISITDARGCGPLELDGMQDCICTSVAGEMSNEVLDTCSSLCVTAEHLGMDTLDDDDASVFILHDAGTEILGTVIGTSQDGSFCYSDYSSQIVIGNTYYISYVVGNDDGSGVVDLNDPCLAVAPGQPVIFYNPPFVSAGADDEVCGYVYDLEANQNNGDGSWGLLSGPGDANFSTVNTMQTTVTVDAYGSYCFSWTGNYEGCTRSDTVCIEFLDAPQVDPASIEINCNPLKTDYTVSFEITGGDESSYAVSGAVGGSLNGNFFTSNLIPSGDSYTFRIFDANGCDTTVISDSFTCTCVSDPGTMDPDTVKACPGEGITVSEAQSPELDNQDILVYVLHEGSSNSIVNKIAENDEPTFTFDPAQMNYNQVYYISSEVGNDDGTGSVNPMDACRIVSMGTPVVWYEPPTAMVDSDIDTITCTRPEVTLDGSPSDDVTGQGLDFSWSTSQGAIISGQNSAQVTVNKSGSYTLLVTDRGSGCTNEVTVNVPLSEDTPEARISDPNTITCDRTTVSLDGSQSSQGSMFSYEWTSNPSGLDIMPDPKVLSPQVNQSGEYILMVTNDENGCTSTASVTVEVDTMRPTAQAVTPGELNCSTTEVMIDATGSSQGSEFDYTWSPTTNMTGSDGLQPVVTAAGSYTLEVEDTGNGCVSTTTVVVDQDTNVIRDAVSDLRNPSCDGQATGLVEITEVIGGTPPFTYILNDDQDQNSTGRFQFLGAGNYDVEIIDAKGCTYMLQDLELIEPAPLEVSLPNAIKIELGDSVQLIPEILPVGRDIISYQWTAMPDDSLLACDTCDELTVSPKGLTIYEVTIVDENGCVGTAQTSVAVEIPRNVYIPNIFTPNGDGVNDNFFLQAKEDEINIVKSMEIYDRWGNRVFQRTDIPPNSPDVGWDGTNEGERLNPAVFVYVIEVEYFDGVTEQIKGDVTLVR